MTTGSGRMQEKLAIQNVRRKRVLTTGVGQVATKTMKRIAPENRYFMRKPKILHFRGQSSLLFITKAQRYQQPSVSSSGLLGRGGLWHTGGNPARVTCLPCCQHHQPALPQGHCCCSGQPGTHNTQGCSQAVPAHGLPAELLIFCQDTAADLENLHLSIPAFP